MIHVRFLLVAVIIQDIGLLLDSNNSGEITLVYGQYRSQNLLLAALP